MIDFMLEELGANGLYAVFHQDAGQGFFFLYRSEANEVLAQEQVYAHQPYPPVTEADIQVMWITDVGSLLIFRGKAVCFIDSTSMGVKCAFPDGFSQTHDLAKPDLIKFRERFRYHRRIYWQSRASW